MVDYLYRSELGTIIMAQNQEIVPSNTVDAAVNASTPPTLPTPPAPTNEPASVIPSTSALGHESINPFRLVFPDLALYSVQSRWDDLVRTAELADLKKVEDVIEPLQLYI